MEFNSAKVIEQIVWQMRLRSFEGGLNRARIDSLANGSPPYPADEAKRNGVEVNVNDLTLTRLSHDARMQLYRAFNKPGNYFRLETDSGAQTRRAERGAIVTKLMNRTLKRCNSYYEVKRSRFAQLVLHGIGPSSWPNQHTWRPSSIEITDVLIPSRTLLTFENLPYFAIFRSYTGRELMRHTEGITKENNPGWNMRVVKRALDWLDKEAAKLNGRSAWSDFWLPEKQQIRTKENSGVYGSDLVPTVDCYDFYYWSDEGEVEGWRRRIIFDAHGGYHAWMGDSGYARSKSLPKKNLINSDKGQFLFNSGSRPVATKLSDILHFQFADLSATAPHRYHEVRSLGFLTYAACHLLNRLNCSFSEAVFENLMMYMRSHSLEEAEAALTVQLANRRIIDNSVQFVPASERWQPDANLALAGINQYREMIDRSSASYTQNLNSSRDRTEKTKFQVMAEVQAMQTLIGAALMQAFRYEENEYNQILKRMLNPDSRNADVLEFRAAALAKGIPEKLLNAECWELTPERLYGDGNATMELTIAQQLMEWRSAFPPTSQQIILRDATLALTGDADKANQLVPHEPAITRTKHDAMVAFGSLMAGATVAWTPDQDQLEIVETLIAELGLTVNRIVQSGGMASPDKVMGMRNVHQSILKLLQSIERDPARKPKVAALQRAVAQLGNEISGMQKRLQQAAEAQQGGNGEVAKAQAKAEAMRIEAEARAANTRESHAQRTAQRQAQAELEEQRTERQHKQKLRHAAEDQALKVAGEEAKQSALEDAKTKSE